MSESVNWSYEIIKWVSTLIAAGGGAWLSIRFFPLKAKHDQWLWSKKIEAQELVFDTLSEIVFVAQNHLRSEYGERFSMAGLRVTETEKIIFERVRLLHKRDAGLSLFLTNEQSSVLEGFIESTQSALDAARESWSRVNPEDPNDIEQHTNNTISAIGGIAEESLHKLKPLIKKEYQ